MVGEVQVLDFRAVPVIVVERAESGVDCRPTDAHFLLAGMSNWPKKIFVSTLPVLRSLDMIVLTFRNTDTFTVSSAEKYVSCHPIMRPLLSLFTNMFVLLSCVFVFLKSYLCPQFSDMRSLQCDSSNP